MANVAPNQTLYVTNLPDKLRKDDLRVSLYTLFATYGPVLDVVALKTMKMRGQAFIVYRDVQASTQAMRALQGFSFFEKQMKIEYAKSRSKIIDVLEGNVAIIKPEEPAAAQQSVFDGPGLAPTQPDRGKSPLKRQRESDDEAEDVPMEEDDEGEAPMEDSSDDD